jgi:hypothetical protein
LTAAFSETIHYAKPGNEEVRHLMRKYPDATQTVHDLTGPVDLIDVDRVHASLTERADFASGCLRQIFTFSQVVHPGTGI